MAIFRPGPLVGAIAGTVGTTVFRQGPYGPVVQKSPTMVRKGSIWSRYRAVDAAFAASMWDYQDQATRMAWETVASQLYRSDRLGVRKQWRGRDLFMRQVILDGSTGPLAAYPVPANPRPQPVIDVGAFWQANFDLFTLFGVPSGPSVTWRYRVSAFRSYKLGSYGRPSWAFISSGALTGSNGADLTNPFEFRLGQVQHGEGYGVKVETKEDGSLWGLAWTFREMRPS